MPVNKMDSERVGCSCSDKAFGPPRAGGQPYICRTCGEEGTVAIVTWTSMDYDRLRAKKQEGGFNAR